MELTHKNNTRIKDNVDFNISIEELEQCLRIFENE
jgi:hypothetical protein